MMTSPDIVRQRIKETFHLIGLEQEMDQDDTASP